MKNDPATAPPARSDDAGFTLTPAEWQALQNGEPCHSWSSIPESAEFPGYEEGTTFEEWRDDQLEQADREERCDVAVLDGPAPDTPARRAYCVAIAAWRAALIRGENPGPRPEPPARPSLRDDPQFRRHLQAQARARRAHVRTVEWRQRLGFPASAALRAPRTRTRHHTAGGQRRPGVARTTRAGPSSRGDDPPPDEPPPAALDAFRRLFSGGPSSALLKRLAAKTPAERREFWAAVQDVASRQRRQVSA
jgi:hypothetical protein